ncbi:MAG: tRNA (N6-isopentenyl adenosine(37)-C2)-methylthiotransferase MiaB [Erysipelotrichia bacterium]|jgi:tRNA-2-methylthio-N6-dimethylallyladenosine synthase|nr:tRNA (N6-isopentenyl adenosine(37)-C2)-methylthiotransferase MiaB [Erysipelotrichia bacterium]
MRKNYELPSLNEAKLRSKGSVNTEQFILDPQLVGIGLHKKYMLHTFGCQANVRDSEVMAGILESLGFTMANSDEDADLILLNTCAIRENAENKVFGQIGNLKHLKQKNPDLIIGIAGCMAQEEVVVNKILQSYHQVDLVFGTHNIHRLGDLVYKAMFSKEKTIEVYSKEGDIIENLPERRFGEHKAWVNIMYGCDKFCTYCIVPFTRGKERSRSVEDILDEVNDLKSRGFKEVTLLGQNVNSYGKDLQLEGGFAYLLKEVALTGIERIRFTTSHPWDFTQDMVNTIAAYPNIMPYIHLPVQSGNNDILKIMGRRYTVEEYKDTVRRLKEAIPHLTFSTDIIVGFPNESDEQFNDTLALYDEMKYDFAFTFIYSPRSGTPAAKFDDNVSLEVKKKRLAALNERVKKYALEHNQAMVNQIVEVLVDGPSKKDPSIVSGYTPHQKLVNFKAKDVKSGDIVHVKVTDAKTWFLLGEQI